jgi:hypothetical protein
MRYFVMFAAWLAVYFLGLNPQVLSAEDAKKEQPDVGVSMYLENNGYLNDIYPIITDLYLTDIFEALLLERPEIVAKAVREVRPSIKDVRVVRAQGGELPSLGTSEKELEAQGKLLVGVDVWRPDASQRLKLKGYGKMPKVRLDITLQQPDQDANWMSVGLLFAPPLSAEDAARVLRRLADTLAEDLPQFSQEYVRKRIDAKTEPFDKQGRIAVRELEQSLNVLRATTGGSGQGVIVDRLAQQDRQLFDARLSLAGLDAHEKAVIQELAKAEKSQTREADDEVIGNLKEIFRLRSEQFERIRKLAESGQTSKQETEAAEAAMLEAKISFEKARAAAQRDATAGRVQALNDDLSKLAIERTEIKARLEFLEKARDTGRGDLEAAHRDEDQTRQMESRIRRIEQERDRAFSERDRIQAASYLIKPLKLTVPTDPFAK